MNSEMGEDSRGRKRMFKVSDRQKQIQCFYGAVGSRGGQSEWKRRRWEAEGAPDGREAVSSLRTGATCLCFICLRPQLSAATPLAVAVVQRALDKKPSRAGV